MKRMTWRFLRRKKTSWKRIEVGEKKSLEAGEEVAVVEGLYLEEEAAEEADLGLLLKPIFSLYSSQFFVSAAIRAVTEVNWVGWLTVWGEV